MAEKAPKLSLGGGWETNTGNYYEYLLLHTALDPRQIEDARLHIKPSKGKPAINEYHVMRFLPHTAETTDPSG